MKGTLTYLTTLLFFSAFFSLNAKAQLQANFTASIKQGCSPLSVQFNDASAGNPTEWLWNLGNGGTSTFPDPGAIYITPGTYLVTLTVKNGNGETSTKIDSITVYSQPQVEFNASPPEGCAPLNVQFQDQSIAGSGTITSWVWDFGDGNQSNGQNPLHTYNISDTFNITLAVTNSFGCSQSLTKNEFIKINGTVTAGYSYTYIDACDPPVEINFKNQSVSSEALTYQWFFGDGGTSTEINPAHTYVSSGDYSVQLIAVNISGCRDTITQTVSISSAKANFSISGSSCINEPVFFEDSSSTRPLSANWQFGDGATAAGIASDSCLRKPRHIYNYHDRQFWYMRKYGTKKHYCYK